LVEDAIEFKLPALSYEIYRALENKVDMEYIGKELDKKADKEYIEKTFLDRLNKLEE